MTKKSTTSLNGSSSFTTDGRLDGIHAAAYSLWEEAGSPVGRALDFWLEAEQQMERKGFGGSSHQCDSQPISKVATTTASKNPSRATQVGKRKRGQQAAQH